MEKTGSEFGTFQLDRKIRDKIYQNISQQREAKRQPQEEGKKKNFCNIRRRSLYLYLDKFFLFRPMKLKHYSKNACTIPKYIEGKGN